jgi:hypothetical protein
MKRHLPLFLLAGGLVLWACTVEESLQPAGGARSGGEVQHAFSTALPEDLREQAKDALARDAWRREHRFLEAAQPGHLFDATRVVEADVEAGRWTSDDLFQIGGQLFNFAFTRDVGFGGRDLPPLARFHTGRRGGPDAAKCASCHWRGGPAGGGDGADAAYLDGDGNAQSSALARNPIALLGAGFVEILATEMSAELAAAKQALLDEAAKKGTPVKGELTAKGISFGSMTAKPDGSLSTSAVAGVDADLVVKPFGWKGNVPTIRDAVEDALLIHHGMESDYLVAHAPKERIGPFGGADPDGDAITNEITEGQVSVLTLFVAMQETPQILAPPDATTTLAWGEGRARFESLGCATCHVPSLPLASTTFVLPSRGGGTSVKVDLATDAAEPRIAASIADGKMRAFLFSDLKRHDLGAALAEPRADRGVPGHLFLTRPLWGVARSGPYLHDGRAATLEAAILAHGGEAQEARDAYAALGDPERGTVRVFLTSLTRARRLVTQ